VECLGARSLSRVVADHLRLDRDDDGGRPRWIDYRMAFGTGQDLHLHVVARGDYDTSVFAYGIIRRGERFGLRIVGSLKSQPALNVLAIYEK
jgi:hypothetical protein